MKNTAYTLVEVMVSLSLLTMICMGVYGVFQVGNTIFTKDMTLLDMQQQSRNAADRMCRELRQASSQVITANYNSTTNDKLSFTMPTATNVQYYLTGTNLIREYPAGTSKIIASNIGLLKYTLNGSLLQVQIRADRTSYQRTVSFLLTERARLRNE